MDFSMLTLAQAAPVAAGLREVRDRLSAALDVSDAMADPAAYVRGTPGKLLRPALLLACASVVGRVSDEAVDAAVAIELIHTASLVHDDVVDRADLRRGMPSARLVFGDREAVLLGDYLFTTAFEILNRLPHRSMMTLMSRTVRAMSAGELSQLRRLYRTTVTESACLDYINRKTASLMSACCKAGAISGGASSGDRERLALFGWNLGMAYQIADDITDVTGSLEDDGKPPGSDLRAGVVTLPLLRLLADSSWASRVERMWAEGRCPDTDVAEILEGVRATGGLAYAAEIARVYCRDALQCVEPFGRAPGVEVLAGVVAVIDSRCGPAPQSTPTNRSSLQPA